MNDGDVHLASGDDGVHAESSLRITGGTVTVSASVEGLEAAAIAIAGGTIDVTSSDDGLNASTGTTTDDGSLPGGGGGAGGSGDGSTLVVSGGELRVDAQGDGLDSNGTAEIAGGTIVVNGPTGSGNGALDAQAGLLVSGGTLVATGSAGMAESPESDSTQGWVAAAVSGGAGATVQLVDASGAVIAETTPTKAFATVVISAAGITTGQEYSIVVDGTVTTVTAGTAISGGGMGGMTPPDGGSGAGAPPSGGRRQ